MSLDLLIKIHILFIYYTRKVNENSEINVSIDCNGVLKKFPEIKYINVITIKDKTKEEIDFLERSLEREGNESNKLMVPMKTNKKSENTIILSFKDEKMVERLRTSIKLRDSKTKRRKFEKKSKGKEMHSGESVNKCIKIDIINGFIRKMGKVSEEALNDSLRIGLEVMFETLQKVIYDWKIKEIIDEREIRNVEDVIENRKSEIDTYEKFRDSIFIFVENEEKKKELLILCFDSLYKFIYSMDENVYSCMVNYFNYPIYKYFLKNYFIGHCRQNQIVITMDDLEKEIKRGHVPDLDDENENEDLKKGKKRKIEMNRNKLLRQTDK